MQFKKLAWAAAALVLSAGLASCNIGKSPEPTIDVNAVYTAAAGTMIAQLSDQQTQTAGAVSPTPLVSPTALATFTPLATFPLGIGGTPLGIPLTTFGTPVGALTPLPSPAPVGTGIFSFPVGCNDAMLIGSGPEDGTREQGAKVFEANFDFQNVGTCVWDEGYSFAFKSGDPMQGNDIKILHENDFTKPGHSQNFVLQLTPPIRAGEYKGYWQMKGDDGQWFGSLVWVDIVVK
jgi:hypothetical protein